MNQEELMIKKLKAEIITQLLCNIETEYVHLHDYDRETSVLMSNIKNAEYVANIIMYKSGFNL